METALWSRTAPLSGSTWIRVGRTRDWWWRGRMNQALYLLFWDDWTLLLAWISSFGTVSWFECRVVIIECVIVNSKFKVRYLLLFCCMYRIECVYQYCVILIMTVILVIWKVEVLERRWSYFHKRKSGCLLTSVQPAKNSFIWLAMKSVRRSIPHLGE